MTQKHGTGQCPEREWLLGGSELRGMLRCVPGVVCGMAGGQPSWQGGMEAVVVGPASSGG